MLTAKRRGGGGRAERRAHKDRERPRPCWPFVTGDPAQRQCHCHSIICNFHLRRHADLTRRDQRPVSSDKTGR